MMAETLPRFGARYFTDAVASARLLIVPVRDDHAWVFRMKRKICEVDDSLVERYRCSNANRKIGIQRMLSRLPKMLYRERRFIFF